MEQVQGKISKYPWVLLYNYGLNKNTSSQFISSLLAAGGNLKIISDTVKQFWNKYKAK